MKEAHRWSFTFNNYPKSFLRHVKSKRMKNRIRFIVIGLEHGEVKKTIHLQGYVEMKHAQDLAYMKKTFHKKIRWVQSGGSAQQNIKYCTKENLIYEYGTPCKQGNRGDIREIVTLIQDGAGIRSMLRAGKLPCNQKLKYAENVLKYLESERLEEKPVIWWLWGATGTGKSRWARTEAKRIWPHYDLFAPTTWKWWDGYDGQEVILFDEFRPNEKEGFSYASFLKTTDLYPFRVQTKGSTRQMKGKVLIFTTPNNPIETMGAITSEDLGQMMRRITLIKEFEEATEVGGNTVTNSK